MKKSCLLGVIGACLAGLSLNANAELINGSVLSFTAYGGGTSIPADGNGS